MREEEIPVFVAPREPRPILIAKAKRPWGWMGNMARFGVEFEGEAWPSTEALFQALRFAAEDGVRQQLRMAPAPYAAKTIARENVAAMAVAPMSPQDVENMRLVLRLKVEQNAARLAAKLAQLVESGDVPIIENATGRARGSGLFWGAELVDSKAGVWRGWNRLGQLWMELREELRQRRV